MSQAPRRVMWVLGALALVSVVGMIVAGSRILGYDPDRPRGPSAALMGQPAPPLSLPIVAGAGAAEGDRIDLASLRGRVVVLDFWASWCGPCRQSIPALNEVHERYGSRVDIFGVNVESGLPRASIVAAHRDFGASFPSLLDERYQGQSAYLVQSIPTMVIIDREGIVRWVETGVPDAGAVGRRLDRLLDDAP